MNNGFAVIDADQHVMEPSDLWDRYLEPEFRGARESLGPFSRGAAERFPEHTVGGPCQQYRFV
jgi:hypothetical protein